MKRIWILAIGVAVGLSGCKAFVQAKIYTTDLQAVIAGETLTTTIRINVDMPHMEACSEHGDRVLEEFAKHFVSVKGDGCKDVGMDTRLLFDAETDLVRLDEAAIPPERAMTVAVDESEAGLGVFLIFNPEAQNAIWNGLPENITSMTPEVDEYYVRALIMNDGPGPVIVVTEGVYLSGVPVLEPRFTQVARRSELSILLSNVSGDAAVTLGVPIRVASIIVE